MGKKNNNYYKQVQTGNNSQSKVEEPSAELLTENKGEEISTEKEVKDDLDSKEDINEITTESSVENKTEVVEETLEKENDTTTSVKNDVVEKTAPLVKDTNIVNSSADVFKDEETTEIPEEHENKNQKTTSEIVKDGFYIQILSSIPRDKIFERLLGINYEKFANSRTVFVGPIKSNEEAIRVRKKIIGFGLRCKIQDTITNI